MPVAAVNAFVTGASYPCAEYTTSGVPAPPGDAGEADVDDEASVDDEVGDWAAAALLAAGVPPEEDEQPVTNAVTLTTAPTDSARRIELDMRTPHNLRHNQRGELLTAVTDRE